MVNTKIYTGIGGWTMCEELITPDIAAAYLQHTHPDQRKKALRDIAGLENDMRNGEFRLTHQGIAFDAEGRLVDGQHRLTAVVNSGCTVRLLVFRGLGALEDPIDRNRIRSLAFISKRSTHVVAALGVLKDLQDGTLLSWTAGKLTKDTMEKAARDAAESIDRIDRLCAENGISLHNSTGPRSSVTGALYYAGSVLSDGVLSDFLGKFSERIATTRDDLESRFRNYLAENRATGGKAGRADIAFVTLNVLLAKSKGKNLAKLYNSMVGYREFARLRLQHNIQPTILIAG